MKTYPYLCSVNQLNYFDMGLDMYLSRTKKVKGLSISDYQKIDTAVSYVDTKKITLLILRNY